MSKPSIMPLRIWQPFDVWLLPAYRYASACMQYTEFMLLNRVPELLACEYCSDTTPA